jgi:hypothetical protein
MSWSIKVFLEYCLGKDVNTEEKETDSWENSSSYVSMYQEDLFNVARILTLRYLDHPVSVRLNEKKSQAEFIEEGTVIAQVVVTAKNKKGPDSAEVVSRLNEAEKVVFTLYLPNLRVSFSDPPKI